MRHGSCEAEPYGAALQLQFPYIDTRSVRIISVNSRGDIGFHPAQVQAAVFEAAAGYFQCEFEMRQPRHAVRQLSDIIRLEQPRRKIHLRVGLYPGQLPFIVIGDQPDNIVGLKPDGVEIELVQQH